MRRELFLDIVEKAARSDVLDFVLFRTLGRGTRKSAANEVWGSSEHRGGVYSSHRTRSGRRCRIAGAGRSCTALSTSNTSCSQSLIDDNRPAQSTSSSRITASPSSSVKRHPASHRWAYSKSLPLPPHPRTHTAQATTILGSSCGCHHDLCTRGASFMSRHHRTLPPPLSHSPAAPFRLPHPLSQAPTPTSSNPALWALHSAGICFIRPQSGTPHPASWSTLNPRILLRLRPHRAVTALYAVLCLLQISPDGGVCKAPFICQSFESRAAAVVQM